MVDPLQLILGEWPKPPARGHSSSLKTKLPEEPTPALTSFGVSTAHLTLFLYILPYCPAEKSHPTKMAKLMEDQSRNQFLGTIDTGKTSCIAISEFRAAHTVASGLIWMVLKLRSITENRWGQRRI